MHLLSNIFFCSSLSFRLINMMVQHNHKLLNQLNSSNLFESSEIKTILFNHSKEYLKKSKFKKIYEIKSNSIICHLNIMIHRFKNEKILKFNWKNVNKLSHSLCYYSFYIIIIITIILNCLMLTLIVL